MKQTSLKKGLALCLILAIAITATVSLSFSKLPLEAVEAKSNGRNIKNVIMMVPDGMSIGATTLARYYLDNEGDVPLAMDAYVTALVKTRWANGPITDSAPAGTALATGNKSITGALGVDENLLPKATILEAAQLKGMATGLIATSEFMHATPAAYSAHDSKRSNYASIAEQMLNQKIDVLFGTGSSKVSTSTLDILGIAMAKGYQIVENRNELLETSSGIVWGNFQGTIGGTNNLSYDLDRNASSEPSLAEMTMKAIEILKEDKDGFFLMVEGSKIDWAAHANDTVGIVTDTLAFDQAFKAAVEFAKKDGHTIVVAVTDHGNSGITIGNTYASAGYDKDTFSILNPITGATKTAEGALALIDTAKSDASKKNALVAYGINPYDASIKKEIDAFLANPTTSTLIATMNKKCAIGYTTGGHTGEDVPLYVYAPNSINLPKGIIDNTDVAKYIAGCLDINLVEATNKLFVDVTVSDTNPGDSEWTYTTSNGKNVTVKANQSSATINGKIIDLDGQVALFINGRFYVPSMLLDMISYE